MITDATETLGKIALDATRLWLDMMDATRHDAPLSAEQANAIETYVGNIRMVLEEAKAAMGGPREVDLTLTSKPRLDRNQYDLLHQLSCEIDNGNCGCARRYLRELKATFEEATADA